MASKATKKHKVFVYSDPDDNICRATDADHLLVVCEQSGKTFYLTEPVVRGPWPQDLAEASVFFMDGGDRIVRCNHAAGHEFVHQAKR